MRGWRTLLAKDWKLIRRNRLLLSVLIVYPFLIMGVIGAAFQESGRPVPVGLVNLDDPGREGVLCVVLDSPDAGRTEGEVRRRAYGYGECTSEEQALADLEAGKFNLVIAREDGRVGGRRLYGALMDSESLQSLVMELEDSATEARFYTSFREAADSLAGMEGGVLLALPHRLHPSLGESLWVGGESYDALRLIREFSGDVVDLEIFPGLEEARGTLREGRVDAVVVLPPGFVHRLKTLEKVAEVNVILDQSNLVKAEFAETGIRGFFSRVTEEVVEEKMRAVVAGLYVLVSGGDFFGTPIIGLERIREDLADLYVALSDRPELGIKVQEGIDLADMVIEDIEKAADYLRGTALPVDLRISSVAGRPLAAKDAVVPALIVLSMLWTGVLCGAVLMVLEEEEGMRARLRLTPAGPLAMVTAKLILASGVVILQSLVMLLLAVAVFRTFASGLWISLLIIAVSSLSFIGIGQMLAAFARQVAGAVIMSVLVTFPLIFLTGAIFPLTQMPAFMRGIARASPPTYALDALSGVMLRGEGLAGVFWEIMVLLGFGATLLFAGSLLSGRKSQ